MVVISLTIIESTEQIVSGIPRTVAITTNIPATIFYTLDGTDPTLFSTIYTGPISIPFNQLSVILKVLASDGINTSPVVAEIYTTSLLDQNARLPHSATDVPPGTVIPDLYPFGTAPNQPMGQYLSPGDAGTTVDNPDLTQISGGFDADGNPTKFSNAPFDVENYEIVYSTTDAEGQRGPGIGTLPAGVIIKKEEAPPEESEVFSNLFDPRALVIYQDASKEDPELPPTINKQYFSLEDPSKARDGSLLLATGLDAPSISGSFVKAFYNPRDNTMTYYYRDSWSNRWVISKQPYQSTGNFNGEISGAVFGRGSRHVFEWVFHQRRVLG